MWNINNYIKESNIRKSTKRAFLESIPLKEIERNFDEVGEAQKILVTKTNSEHRIQPENWEGSCGLESIIKIKRET